MDSTLYISHPTLYVAYTDVYCVSSDERLSAMMSKRWVIGWKLWKESYKKQFSELIYRVLRGVYGTGHWSFLIPHIDPDLGLYTICLDICARAQKCWSQRNPGATILTSWWLREIQTWVRRQFVLILVHEYKVWVTRQYHHSNFDTLIWFSIVHYHTCNVDVKPHVADYITGWNLLSHNCVFDT